MFKSFWTDDKVKISGTQDYIPCSCFPSLFLKEEKKWKGENLTAPPPPLINTSLWYTYVL